MVHVDNDYGNQIWKKGRRFRGLEDFIFNKDLIDTDKIR